jgi:hypothetical protein
MKKFFTLAAASAMAAASLGAQAQVTVDGQLTAAEVSATGYTLVGRDLGARGFSPTPGTNDAGLIALYAAADATNLYFFLVGTLQNDATPATISNSFQLYISRPGVAGVARGTALPRPAAATAPAVNTSFQNMGGTLDLPGDMAIAIKGNGVAAQYQVDGVVYMGGATPTATAAVLSGAVAGNATTGAALPIAGQTGSLAVFNGAQVAYRTSANLNSNPGFGVAGAGAVPANGLEISISRASIGLAATGGIVQIFALQNNGDGGFASSDYIPQGPLTNANPGSGTPANDFAAIPGAQVANVAVGAGTTITITATRAAVAKALQFGLFPNPGNSANAKITYTVPQGKQDVSLSVFDATGRKVRSFSGAQAGQQTYSLNNLRAGIYAVKLSVGGQETSGKLVIE